MAVLLPTTCLLKNGERVVLKSPAPDTSGAVLAFLKQLHLESSKNLNASVARYDGFTLDMQQDRIEKMNAAPSSFYLVAFHDGNVVASLGLHAEEAEYKKHVAWLGMGILKDWQSKGLGQALLERCVAEGQKLGITNFLLSVRAYNQAALSLYRKMGFVQVGTIKDAARIEGSLVDEHVMQRVFVAL